MKNSFKIKSFIAGLALIALPGAVFAKDVTLDVITQNGAFYQAVVDAYAASGAKYKVKLQPPSKSYDGVAQRAVRASMVGTPPDV